MYLIYCACSCWNEDCIVLFLPHGSTRNVWTYVNSRTFFRHSTPIFQRLVYLEIRNTATLTSTVCAVLRNNCYYLHLRFAILDDERVLNSKDIEWSNENLLEMSSLEEESTEPPRKVARPDKVATIMKSLVNPPQLPSVLICVFKCCYRSPTVVKINEITLYKNHEHTSFFHPLRDCRPRTVALQFRAYLITNSLTTGPQTAVALQFNT